MRDLGKEAAKNNIFEHQKDRVIGLRKELDEVMLLEDRSWRQKAKLKSVKETDVNTRLFHRVVNRRRMKSLIKEFELNNGMMDRRSEVILKRFVILIGTYTLKRL